MTKTQQKMIDRASSQGIIVVITGFNTARKVGQKRYGTREHDAAVALVNAGRIKFLRVDSGIHYGRFGADHYTNHVFQVL